MSLLPVRPDTVSTFPHRCSHWGMPPPSSPLAAEEMTEIVGHFGRDWTTGEQWHCPACIALLGYTPDEQQAVSDAAWEMDFADLIHPDDRSSVLHKVMTLAIGEADTETWECRLRRAHNQGWIWVRVEAWIERGKDARPTHLTARVAVRAQMPPDSFTMPLRG